jgi:anti-sigma B factor antagonist
MTSNSRIDVSDVDHSKLVRFHDSLLFDDKSVHEVMKQIEAILSDDGSPVHLMLDFSGVDLISSALMSKLILLRRRINACGGTIRLCCMSDDIHTLFRRAKLDRLFPIDHEMPAVIGSR